MGAIFILLAVGALIGTWSMAGTTATLTYYGVKLINPAWFYLACVIICGLISLSIGSSWTAAGTIGVALIAVAEVLGLNPAIAAGAIAMGLGGFLAAKTDAQHYESEAAREGKNISS